MEDVADMLRRGKRVRWLTVVALTLLALLATAARADDDLPGRVGRVSEFAGQLYLAPEDRTTDWESIGLNYPITNGDNLWVTPEGRAEIDFGAGQFRLAGDTSVHVAEFDDRRLALFVASGRVIVRLRVLDPGDVARIDTPTTQVEINRPGLYRVDVAADRQETMVTVREGEAAVRLATGMQQALPGTTVTVSGPDETAAVRNGFYTDGFDAWSASRDRRYEYSRSAAYVSRQMVGWRDLDDYGTWETYPTYGAVWFPTTVAVGWVPYRFGIWTWVDPWGWTWVDDAPWGYAPFHYGRWAWVGGRWGWCPGAYVARPVWAPALVGWYGGPGWGLSARFGAPIYGWVPLGWGEAFRPHWNCSANCWHAHNRPYGVNLAERPGSPPTRYANMAAPGAITAVSGAVFTGARPVAANLINVPTAVAAVAPVLASAPLVKPEPLRIPGKPTVGAPPLANRFYPTGKPGIVTKPLVANAGPGNVPAMGGAPAVKPAPSVVPPPKDSRREARPAPAVPTPNSGGRTLSAPPVWESKPAAPSIPIPLSASQQVQGARGAYTGAMPTPGPKVPIAMPDRGLSLPPSMAPAPHPMPQTAPAPQYGVPVAPHTVPIAPQQAPQGGPGQGVRSSPAQKPAGAGGNVASPAEPYLPK